MKNPPPPKNRLKRQDVEKVLTAIRNFENTDNGFSIRSHFSNIIREALDSRLVSKDRLYEMGLSKTQMENALNMFPTAVEKNVRNNIIRKLKGTARKAFTEINQAQKKWLEYDGGTSAIDVQEFII